MATIFGVVVLTSEVAIISGEVLTGGLVLISGVVVLTSGVAIISGMMIVGVGASF